MWTDKESVYKEAFMDEMGIFFTKENFPELDSNYEDVGPILRKAIKKLTDEQIYGNLYIPEGEYPIKSMVKIPPSVRLIGYGEKRPLFFVPDDGGEFDEPLPKKEADIQESFFEGYPGAKYMLWFVGERDTEKEDVRDANAGTFYSAVSNINFRIDGLHDNLIVMRAHFAQHGFVNHCHFDLGTGLAALYDVGNEMEDITVEGGEYGFICRMTSPGWPFALLDSTFNNQREAAILTSYTGFTGFRLRIMNTKKAFDLYRPEAWEKLYLEDCVFVNISEAAISFKSHSVVQQTNLKDIYCDKVHTLIDNDGKETKVNILKRQYVVRDFVAGYVYSDTDKEPAFTSKLTTDAYKGDVKIADLIPKSDIPALPPMTEWVNVKDFGAVGDGETDDTEAIRTALGKENVIFFPQGIYHVTDTITLNPGNKLIGLNPISTQIVIDDDEPRFAGFGAPKAVVESAKGASNLINGIGIDTKGKNPRAVGLKWTASKDSYVNDVKFLGGHGYMYRDGSNPYLKVYNPGRTADYDIDKRWDFQYSSLWVTKGGGGIFKDVWSCSPYTEAGIMISNTDTPCTMYAISLEHHVRHEIKIVNVKNLKIYALQTEEEKAEGLSCIPMEIVSSENILLAAFYLFRVVAVDKNFDYGIMLYDSKDITFINLHNKAQMQFTFPVTVKDMNSGFVAKSSDYARLTVKGITKPVNLDKRGLIKLFDGFDFIQGPAVDKKGNLYFTEKLTKSIFKYDLEKQVLIPIQSIHFVPSALAFDTTGKLIVAADYSALRVTKPGSMFQEHDLKNFHPFFSWFYQRSEKVYTMDVTKPYDSFKELPVKTSAPANAVFIRPAELDYGGWFDKVKERSITEYYEATDGVTLIEKTVDLARSLMLNVIKPGEPALLCDDAGRRVLEVTVDDKGNYVSENVVATRGQYGAYKDDDGIVWTVEDRIYGFKEGKQKYSLSLPEDASQVTGFGNMLYIIGRHSVYILNK